MYYNQIGEAKPLPSRNLGSLPVGYMLLSARLLNYHVKLPRSVLNDTAFPLPCTIHFLICLEIVEEG